MQVELFLFKNHPERKKENNMYTILCKDKSLVNNVVLLLAEVGVVFRVVEEPTIENWVVLSPTSEKLTTTEEVKRVLKEGQRKVLHD